MERLIENAIINATQIADIIKGEWANAHPSVINDFTFFIAKEFTLWEQDNVTEWEEMEEDWESTIYKFTLARIGK